MKRNNVEKMEEYILHLGEKLSEAEYTRVHAILVTRDGRILMRYKNGEPRITGGRIDAEDKGLEDTLRREVLEEINCKIDKCDYLGYLEVNKRSNESSDVMLDEMDEQENWARMVARVAEIGAAKPDPDRENDWVYGRVLMPAEMAKEKVAQAAPLGNTRKLVECAIKVAREKGYFTEEISNEVEVINEEMVGGEVVPKI